MTTQLFRHNDPRDRLSPANARLSILHSFEVAFSDADDIDAMFAFLADKRDIWLRKGLAERGAAGTTPINRGEYRLLFFVVETPRRDLAMLFKLTFGGAA